MNEIASRVFADSYPAAERYASILATRGIEWGLLGPREKERIWDRHILNSAALASLIPSGSTVVDVGSGAGLPGIPLAILRPDLEVTLLEPLLRRHNFLNEAVAELGLADRVTVVRGRAEDCDDTFDVVTCRAVANLGKLLGWCTPLFYPDGRLVALKGDSVHEEIAEAEGLLRASHLRAEVLSVRADAQAETTTALVVTPVR